MTNATWLSKIETESSETLKEWRHAIDSELKKREAKDKAEARRKIKELAETHGIDLSSLAESGSGKAKGNRPQRYRNPDDQFQTWSGVGRKPGWVKKWLDSGKDLAELEIN